MFNNSLTWTSHSWEHIWLPPPLHTEAGSLHRTAGRGRGSRTPLSPWPCQWTWPSLDAGVKMKYDLDLVWPWVGLTVSWLRHDIYPILDALSIMHFPLCTFNYARFIMHFPLCTFDYAHLTMQCAHSIMPVHYVASLSLARVVFSRRWFCNRKQNTP